MKKNRETAGRASRPKSGRRKSGGTARHWAPASVRNVLHTLHGAGYEAWCVGGCVRDMLLGQVPHDWDVTTSAPPETVMALFQRRAIPTGLKHGTVTIRSGHEGVEVTTYRCDGEYSGHRRPESVTFTSSLEEDLRRRDFTVNAMAMSLDGDLRDPFHGREDLHNGILRCVGDPRERFNEDALRMMRALRFAATRGFTLEPDITAAVHAQKDLLNEIAIERVQQEVLKLLPGKRTAAVLREFPDVFGVFWPELLPCIGFDQRNPHHCYDVWEHTLHAMDASPEHAGLRCALLLHDIGKPRTFVLDERGVGHFPGHAAVSRDLAEEMLRRLRCPNVFRVQVTRLVEWHDREIARTEKAILKALHTFGEEDLRLLIAMKRADNLAQAPAFRGRQRELDEAEAILNKLVAGGACFSLKQLAVDGNDMKRLGLSGPAVGNMLRSLLSRVVSGELPNDRAALLDAARKRIRKLRRAAKQREQALQAENPVSENETAAEIPTVTDSDRP